MAVGRCTVRRLPTATDSVYRFGRPLSGQERYVAGPAERLAGYLGRNLSGFLLGLSGR